MASDEKGPTGPDLTKGVSAGDLPEGAMMAGHVGDDEVLLVRQNGTVFALSPPTARTITARSPTAWWSATRCAVPGITPASSLATGEALAAPALSPLACWQVEERDGKIIVGSKKDQPRAKGRPASATEHIVIVGGGAAGFAAAEMLRRRGFRRADHHAQQRRGGAGRPPEFVEGLSRRQRAGGLGAAARRRLVRGEQDRSQTEDRGGRARYQGQGADAWRRQQGQIRQIVARRPAPSRSSSTFPAPTNRTCIHCDRFADCRAIIEQAKTAKRAVVIGASFIGLEAAAALRARDIEVHVVAPEKRPLERVFGPQLGDFIRALHEEHGVKFHLENSITAIEGKRVMLKSGDGIDADLVVIGVGVRPRIALAEKARTCNR